MSSNTISNKKILLVLKILSQKNNKTYEQLNPYHLLLFGGLFLSMVTN